MTLVWLWYDWYDFGMTFIWRLYDFGMTLVGLWYDFGMTLIWLWHEFGMTLVWRWYDFGMTLLWHWYDWYDFGMTLVCLWYIWFWYDFGMTFRLLPAVSTALILLNSISLLKNIKSIKKHFYHQTHAPKFGNVPSRIDALCYPHHIIFCYDFDMTLVWLWYDFGISNE